MRVLIDYRPALRERSGVGEYTHELVKALLAAFPARDAARPLDLTVFSSSWRDRLDASDLAGATAIDRRVPVHVLNLLWHRFGWPPAETLAGRAFDVTHSSHPLLLPARAAAHVVTIHDLHFLAHPERTRAEIRRDYPALVRAHAHRADRIIVSSAFAAGEVERRLEVPRERIAICAPGAPDWTPRATAPSDGYVLFLGTLEPRKNVGGLLDAYELLLKRRADAGRHVPELVLAGRATGEARAWLDRLERPPLKGVARYIGYVDSEKRRALYEGARLVVQPSFEEGFGMPVLEAMTLGVPVVAADRGSLPEVLGDAGLLVDPEQPSSIAAAITRVATDRAFAATCTAKGLARARDFRWSRTAQQVYDVYQQAIEHRRCASA
ncbi:MAG: glycosyltransferase family 4 protein [Acidobacteriia bacterium]|nr:glycosyltransferase family 4 protein [Terriglobia bacterium]